MKNSSSFDEAAYQRAEEVARLVIKKQHDYGPKNILNSPIGPELGLAVRLYDKIARLVNLVEKGVDPANESLADTAADIMGYGLVLTMHLNGEFTLPLEEDNEDDLRCGSTMYEEIKEMRELREDRY